MQSSASFPSYVDDVASRSSASSSMSRPHTSFGTRMTSRFAPIVIEPVSAQQHKVMTSSSWLLRSVAPTLVTSSINLISSPVAVGPRVFMTSSNATRSPAAACDGRQIHTQGQDNSVINYVLILYLFLFEQIRKVRAFNLISQRA